MADTTEGRKQLTDEYQFLTLIKHLLCQNYEREIICLINDRLDEIHRIKNELN